MIKLNLDYSKLNPEEINNIKPKTFSTGLAKDFPETNVWLELPNASKEYLQDIKDTAERIQSSVDYFVVIGVGGSSLGAKSAVRLLKKNNKVLFSGNSFDPTAIEYTMALCKGKKFAINLISRSGRTLEPLMSFEIFYKELLTRVSERQAKELVFVTTEKDSPLSSFAKEKGFRLFELPLHLCGRFSVLSTSGLLPMAVAGIDISKVLRGAQKTTDNEAMQYACARYLFETKYKKSVEFICSFETRFSKFFEWQKQLFCESLGKENKGLIVTKAIFSTDLHAIGQHLQEGTPCFFETLFTVKDSSSALRLLDIESPELLAIENTALDRINKVTEQGVISAHKKNPLLIFELDTINEETFGRLVFILEKACVINSILLGLNPFNQPGVEKYKTELQKLLKKK